MLDKDVKGEIKHDT